MTSPRFSPVSSDFGGRALSPTLSASSRTTTSLPTDMSDLSSLDGDEDFELIEAPRSERGEIMDEDDALGNGFSESFDDLANRGSTFLASGMMNRSVGVSSMHSSRSGEMNNTADQDILSKENLEESEVLPSRNSLTTLRNSELVDSSVSSSLLKFPDPLDSSFQQLTDADATLTGFSETNLSMLRSGEHGDKTDLEDRATLTDIRGLDASSINEREETTLETVGNMPRTKKEESVTPAAPIIPSPPVGFPFKIDRTLLASKAFRALISLLVVLLASGIMPVWRTKSPHSLITQQASISKMAISAQQATPTPFAQLNKSLSVISSKASKGLIVVGKASPFSSTMNCNPRVTVNTESSEYAKKKAKQLAARRASRDLSLVTKGKNEIMVFQPETKYSSRAADWFLFSPSTVSTLDVKSIKHASSSTLRGIDPLSRLQKPSLAAKNIVNGFQRQWSNFFEGMSVETLKTFSLILSKEVNMIQTETRNLGKQFHPRSKQMINALQKTWEAWTIEMMKAYVKLSMILHDEMMKLQVDLGKSYRKTHQSLQRFGKNIHRFTESSKQNTNRFLRQTRSQAKMNKAFRQLIELQQSSLKSFKYPHRLSIQAKEALNKLKYIASAYNSIKPASKDGKRGKHEFKRTPSKHKFRSDRRLKRVMKSFRTTRKQAERILLGKRKR